MSLRVRAEDAHPSAALAGDWRNSAIVCKILRNAGYLPSGYTARK